MTKSASTFLSVAAAAAASACVGLVGLTASAVTVNAQSVASSTDFTGDQDTKARETGGKPKTNTTEGKTETPRGTSPYSPKTARPEPRDGNSRVAKPAKPKVRVAEPPKRKERIAEPRKPKVRVAEPPKRKKRVAALAKPDSDIVKKPAHRKRRISKSRRHRKSYHRRYVRRSRPRMPPPGYEGFDGPGTYCSYRREPWRKCFNNRYGEYQCRTVGWRRIQHCY